MRLNIRCESARCRIDADSGMKLRDLKNRVKQELNIPADTPVELSLNGSDRLTDDDDSSLSDAGLVSGDLIYLLLPTNQSAHLSQSVRSQQAAATANGTATCATSSAASTSAKRAASGITNATGSASDTRGHAITAVSIFSADKVTACAAPTDVTSKMSTASMSSASSTDPERMDEGGQGLSESRNGVGGYNGRDGSAGNYSGNGGVRNVVGNYATVKNEPENFGIEKVKGNHEEGNKGGNNEAGNSEGNSGTGTDGVENYEAEIARGNNEAGNDDGMEVEVNRYLREPTLLREASHEVCPPSLMRACSELQPHSASEYLCVALHVLMTELGFQPHVFNGGAEGTNTEYIWRVAGGGVRFEYRPLQFREARCQLVCVPMKSVLVVHGSIQVDDESNHKTSLRLKVEDFIKISSIGDRSQMYKCEQLVRLSREFKDTVAYPLLHFVLAETGQTSMSTLPTLPYELQIKILLKLDILSVLRLSETCHIMRSVCHEQSVWRHLYIKDFGSRENLALSQNWNLLYREMYRFKKDMQPHRLNPRLGPYMPLPSLPPIPFSPYLPGFIIGGDYDLNPNFFNPLSPRDPLRIFRPVPGAPRPWPPSAFDPSLHFDETGELPPLHPSNSMNPLGGGRHQNGSGGLGGQLGRHPLSSGFPRFL